MRACSHLDDNKQSRFRQTATWKVGERRIVEEECDGCKRLVRSYANDLGDEALLSGRRGIRPARQMIGGSL